MVFYHGTTKDRAEKIKTEGLIPHRDLAFNTLRENWIGEFDYSERLRAIEGDTPLIYLSPLKKWAKYFAEFRAQYERADEGEILIWGNGNRMKKLGKDQNPNASPAIIKIDIPETYKSLIQNDPESREIKGKVCQCTIPAEYIIAVMVVSHV